MFFDDDKADSGLFIRSDVIIREGCELICPRCGSTYLHHIGVTVFDRKEDAQQVVRTSVDGASSSMAIVSSSDSGNPSDRRDGVVVAFRCEQCGGGTETDRIELTIAQHKGETLVKWRYTKRH